MAKQKILVFMIDALCETDVDYMRTLPNFGQILKNGALVREMYPVYPSFTYPCHISIITGCVVTLASTLLFFWLAPTLTEPLIICLFVLYSLGKGANLPSNMTNGLAHLASGQNADGNAIINTMQQLAGAIGTVFVSTVVASAQAADPSHMAVATATGTQQAFLLVVAFAAAEAVCTAIIFGVFKNRKRAV